MSDLIAYDADALVAAAERAQKLKDEVESTRTQLESLYGQLVSATSSMTTMPGGVSSTSVATLVSKKKLQAQAAQMEGLVSVLNEAAGLTDTATKNVEGRLDLFGLSVDLFQSGLSAITKLPVVVSSMAIVDAFGNLIYEMWRSLNETLRTIPTKLLENYISENPDCASYVTTLREYGYSDKQILDICKKSGVSGLQTEVRRRNLESTASLSESILIEDDDSLPDVSTENGRFQNIHGKQLNCLWFARQKICKILGDDTLFSDDKKLGITFSNWKKYEETGINGYHVDYVDVKDGTSMASIIDALKAQQPCTVMFKMSGHTFTVDRIEGDTVYWSDNFTKGGVIPYWKTGISDTKFDGSYANSPYTGEAISASLEDFAKWYDTNASALQEYVILKKES